MRAFFSRQNNPLVVSVFALAGFAWGVFTPPRPAHACECVQGGWTYRLESFEAAEGGRDHSAFWPETVSLDAYDGTGILWAIERGPETLDRISAEAPPEDSE